MSTRSKLLLPIVLLAALARAAGCSSPVAPPDAGVVSGPATGFSGPISPQGGTITGVFGSGAVGGSALGGFAYLYLNSCPEGQTWVSLGSGSGFACAVAATPSTAGSGELLVQGSGELDGYGGSACPTGQLVQSIDSAGDLGCSLPIASNACGSGWAAAIGSDGALTCSVPTSSAVAPGVVSSTMTTNDWAPTGFGPNVGTVYITSGGTLTGVNSTSAYDGMRVVFVNLSGGTLTVSNYNSGSLAQNRIICPDAITQTIANESSFELEYLTSATAALPGWYMLGPGGFLQVNTVTAAGTIVTSSVITAALGANIAGSSPASITLQKGWTVGGATAAAMTYFMDPTSGPSCAYGTAGSATCHDDATGSADGTAWLRSKEIDDGEGSGSAHTIALFDAGTHGLFVGSNNTTAEDLASSGAPVLTCNALTKGSTDRNFASGVFEVCNGTTWSAVGTINASIITGVIPEWNGSLFVGSPITDNGTAIVSSEKISAQGGADIEGGAVTINTSGAATTTIGGSASGTVSIMAGGSGVLLGSLSESEPIQIETGYTGSGALSVITAGSDRLESDAGSLYIVANSLSVHTNGTPTLSCSSGSMTCSGARCGNNGGVLTLTGANGCTVHYSTVNATTPACAFTAVASTQDTAMITSQSGSAVTFSVYNATGIVTFSGVVDYVCLPLD